MMETPTVKNGNRLIVGAAACAVRSPKKSAYSMRVRSMSLVPGGEAMTIADCDAAWSMSVRVAAFRCRDAGRPSRQWEVTGQRILGAGETSSFRMLFSDAELKSAFLGGPNYARGRYDVQYYGRSQRVPRIVWLPYSDEQNPETLAVPVGMCDETERAVRALLATRP